MKRHALFVGVDRYEDGHIPDLSCAVNDAMDLHGFFKFGVGYDKVELLQNPSGKKDILCAARDLTADLGPGDLFLFFFAGHGFRVGENHFLVCANDFYDDVKHEDDGLSLGQLKRRLAGAFDSALVLDACQSDILATRGGEGIAERDLDLILDTSRDGICGGSLTIVTSCDAGQTAAELTERRHGLFTVAILDLLNEARESNMRIDFSDVFRQKLTRRMCEIAMQSGLHTEQRPRFNCAGNSCFVLLDGVVASSTAQTPFHPSASLVATPTYVVCPICGKKNKVDDTFKCRQCGSDNLCLRHQDEKTFLCFSCAEKSVHKGVTVVEERKESKTNSIKRVQLWEGGPYWADRNIGAENPWDSGYYFWWGDTVGYKWVNDEWVASDGSNYNFSFKDDNVPTCSGWFRKSIRKLRRDGWISASHHLTPDHDAAQKHWGGDWRMPTDEELQDLSKLCDWTWTKVKGVNGYVVRGKGSYSSAEIFLPCAGYGAWASLCKAASNGAYWSSVPYSDYSNAWSLYFGSGNHDTGDFDRLYSRGHGQSVRPLQGFTK